MRLVLLAVALMVGGCSDVLAGTCGPQPITCDDVPEHFIHDPACGTTVCGEWKHCVCEEGEWQTVYMSCSGCPEPDAGVDAGEPDAAPQDAAVADADT
jgi:hypothetical protein